MKWTILAALAALAVAGGFASPTIAQNQQSSPYTLERGFPTPDTVQKARNDADLQRAITAYRFWYPTVSNEGIFNGNRAVGIEDNKGFGIAATGPRQVGFTLNSDTPYGSAVLDLSNGPMVVELPPGARHFARDVSAQCGGRLTLLTERDGCDRRLSRRRQELQAHRAAAGAGQAVLVRNGLRLRHSLAGADRSG